MRNEITKNVIFEFLSGNCTSIQRKSIENWIQVEGNEELFYTYLHEYESLHPQYPIDVEKRLAISKEKLFKKHEPQSERRDQSEFRLRKLLLVGSSAAMVIMGLVLWNPFHVQKKTSVADMYTNFGSGDLVQQVNHTEAPVTVFLPDKSSVVISPNSSISYNASEYDKGKREVTFKGEGFFEVQKKPDSPFIAYANGFVTKVLGTSFTLRSFGESPKNEVIVKTGKVTVYKTSEANYGNEENVVSSVVLSANQKIKFRSSEELLPVPIRIEYADMRSQLQRMSFKFESRPIVEVFDILSDAYHVEIVYDRDKMADCKLTAFLSDEPLYEKIRLICFALNASFSEDDQKFVIESSGCS